VNQFVDLLFPLKIIAIEMDCRKTSECINQQGLAGFFLSNAFGKL
jgi:hypothetical protein